MRKKKLALNSISSLMYQVVAILCSFILPRLLLNKFGSETNGLINSISQFLAIISFLELGVGAVVQSSFYEPLAHNDNIQLSKIYSSANKFFNKIAISLIFYVIILIYIYPVISNNLFSFEYIASLIIVMGISSFAQNYLGVVDKLLISADQRGYIQYTTQAITILLNTLICTFMIYFGSSIQTIKLITAIIFLCQPIVFKTYVKNIYKIDKKILYNGEPIRQKWNGIAQHVSAVVLDNTDTIVLTLFSTLTNVSIYSIYHLIVYGIKQLFTSMTYGLQPLLGELWAKKEINQFSNLFKWVEWFTHGGAVFIFGCTASLIIPFIKIYTMGITDANYVVTLFGLLITLAHGIHCIRLPYNMVIRASGHYKETQLNFVTSTLINLIISVITVKLYGLVGVAFGTLVAMSYQTIWMAWYTSTKIIKRSVKIFVKQISVDLLAFLIAYLICMHLYLNDVSIFSWVILALKTSLIWLICIFLVNLFFYKQSIFEVIRLINK